MSEIVGGQFDWVEVGRVSRQVEKRRARGLDGFTHPGGKMDFEMVDDDDIGALERRYQALFLRLSAPRPPPSTPPLHHDAGRPQTGWSANGLRHMADQSHAACAAPARPSHVGRSGGLVDEHQPGRVKQTLLPPSPRHVSRFCSAARMGFFNRDVVPCEKPPNGGAAADDRMAATIPSRVKSGCLATSSRSQAACASNGDVLPPLGFGGGASEPHKPLHPLHRRTHAHLEPFRRLVPQRACLDALHQPYPQVQAP
jgi:hypothetical protein